MPESGKSRRVLVVDDDDVFRNRLCRALAQREWEVNAAPNGSEAITIAQGGNHDLALVDLRMPGIDGIDVVERLRELNSSMVVIVLTGYGSIATTISAMKKGADYYLSKPADADQIVAAYEKLLAQDEEMSPVPMEAPSLARVEWEHMQRIIADCDGNISQAARVLGIHRRSLQRKLSKFPPAK